MLKLKTIDKDLIDKFFPGSVGSGEWDDYRWHLRSALRDVDSLKRFFIGMDSAGIEDVIKKFPMMITPHFMMLSLSAGHEAADNPILKQVVPDRRELEHDPILNLDPFREQERTPAECVVKRYPDRVVVVTTSRCASLCRYCTRKWNWSENIGINESNIDNVVSYLRRTPEVREVIISGGEPLLLDPALLDRLLSQVLAVDHVEAVRIGSRILSFLPQRINGEITDVLSRHKPVWIVTHFNHPDEITSETECAVDRLIRSGVVLCNQSVLLRGVNDNTAVMKRLLNTLQAIRIKPYYIFQGDLIEGTAHLRSDVRIGIRIMEELRGNTGGICLPYYVVDLPDGGKVPILPEYIKTINDDYMVLINYEGKEFVYKG